MIRRRRDNTPGQSELIHVLSLTMRQTTVESFRLIPNVKCNKRVKKITSTVTPGRGGRAERLGAC